MGWAQEQAEHEAKIEAARVKRATYLAKFRANPCPHTFTVSFYSRGCEKLAGHKGSCGYGPKWMQ